VQTSRLIVRGLQPPDEIEIDRDAPMGAEMDSSGNERRMARRRVRTGFVVSGVAAFLALLPVASPTARAAEPSAADQRCLACHGIQGMEKALGDGNKLSLHVESDTFAKSVHSVVGCAACHTDINLASHPPSTKDIKSARDYSVASANICRGCHADKFDQWQTSVHAALVRDGNAAAPVCTDCHRPHAVIKETAATVEQTPCQNCHNDIYKAYLKSMHAKARSNPDTSYAPLCSGCHSAHAVKPAAQGEGPKAACLGCHADALEKHGEWLPNSGLHLDVVSCPACHAPTAQRKVDLMIYDNQSQSQVTEQKGVPLFEPRARSLDNGQSLDALALWRLLTAFNPEGRPSKVTLRGRLEVSSGPEAHQLADKSKAIRDCRTCHREGSDAFQNVTISIAGPDGRRIMHEASAGVLTSVISTNSVGGFYAIGGTRIKLLDILLILAFVGAVAFAVGHATMRWFFKRYLLANPQLVAGGRPAGNATKTRE
jgi:hypothetical protein